jgi:hypothetical protein
VESFCFILDDTVLIAKRNGVLEVLKVIVDSAEDSIKVISQACYNLPPRDESFKYTHISIHPNVTAGTAHKDTTLEVEKIMGAGQAPESMPLCYPRIDERILGKVSCNITLTYSRGIIIAFTVHPSGPNIISSFDFFVNVSTFLKSPFPYPSQTPVPWEAWGPQNTRWFQVDRQAIYRPHHQTLHGQRAIDAVPCEVLGEYESGNNNVRKEQRLRVRDFNPNAVRRSARGQMEKGWKCRAVTAPSTTFTEVAYEENIISSLPYTEVISEETFYIADVMIGGSQLLLLKVSGSWIFSHSGC